MIIQSNEFRSIPGLRSAVLNESTDGISELALEYEADAPGIPGYMDIITIMHRGRVLFHGKATTGSASNRAGDVTRLVTVSDFRWLMDHQTLGTQLALLKIDGKAQRDLLGAANAAGQSLAAAYDSVMINAPGWACDADGNPREDVILGIDTQHKGEDDAGTVFRNPLAVSQFFLLQRMQRANPGMLYKPNFTTGKLEVWRVPGCPSCTLHTQQQHITDISGITPNYDSMCPGVAVVVQWEETVGIPGVVKHTYSKVLAYPEGLDIAAVGVRVFTATAPDERGADHQAAYIMKQLRAWYDGTNRLQCSGTVSLKMQDVVVSPLAMQLDIAGPGAIDTMNSPITGVEWDFMAQNVTLNLGVSIREPRISTIPFPEYEGSDTTTTGSGGSGSWPSRSGESDSSSSASASSTGSGSGSGYIPSSVSSTTLEPTRTGSGSGGSGSEPGPQPPSTTGGTGTQPTSTTGGTGTGCHCKRYEFDPEWFLVTETEDVVSVSVNPAKLSATVDEMLAGISVDVQVEGLSEVTAFGQLKASLNGNTAQGLDSSIHY